MAVFNKQTNLEKNINNINNKTNFNLTKEFLDNYIEIVKNDDLFIDILLEIVNTQRIDKYNVKSNILFVFENIYSLFVKENHEGINEFKAILKLFLKKEEYIDKETLNNIYSAFSDKSLVLEVYNYLDSINLYNENYDFSIENYIRLTKYLTEARQYFIDDRSLFTSFINLIDNIGIDSLKYNDDAKIKREIKKKINEAKKSNGIYDIDQAKLNEIDRKTESLGLTAEKLSTLTQTAESLIKKYNIEVENISDEINRIKLEEIKALSEEANKIIKQFDTSYLELLNQQKQSILKEKEQLMLELEREIEEKRTRLLNVSDIVAQKINLELNKIDKVSKSSIQKIEDFIASNENVKQMLQSAKDDQEFLERLKQIELITKNNEIKLISSQNETSQNVKALDGLVIPQIIIPEEKEVVRDANYYFNQNVPFKERFDRLMELKQQLIEEEKEIFHEKFDDILTMLLKNRPPYMWGPSGCGKTYMIENQLSRLLGIDVTTNGYIMYEQDVLGYTNSGTGSYVPSNFYRCYKFGEIIFFDELDNGIANATTVLNSFLTSSAGSSYTFPNGEHVKRHENFRIVTAGNTKGAGKTLAHNTRQKLDESVKQRLEPVEVNYDNRIEERILEDYPAWFDFASLFRKAVSECGSQDEVNTIGTFTTRDAQAIKEYKDDNAFNDEQLMEYQIIEDKDKDYLNQIIRKMEDFQFKTKEGKQLFKTFKQGVNRKFNK